jgi:L-fuculose-phosphate aldolase
VNGGRDANHADADADAQSDADRDRYSDADRDRYSDADAGPDRVAVADADIHPHAHADGVAAGSAAGDDEAAVRRAVVAAMRELDQRGLNYGTSGNVGVRVAGGVLVTPSGIGPHRLAPEDLVRLGPRGDVLAGHRRPTSEWRIHVDVLAARPDIGAVVHTHSPEATAVACVGAAIPAVHYAIARTGGPEVRCAPYATYGTPALSANALSVLGTDRFACLLANHGALTLGRTLEAAVALMVELEWLARLWRHARQHGEPVVLADAEIDHVALRFGTYGQPRS